MNRAFLQIYNEELRHVREVAGDFAAAYPKIASRLSIDRESRDTCPDPFVERLLEGFAYLTSRAQLKLEAEFPRFTQGLLETVYPDYLAPSPSAAIVRMDGVTKHNMHETEQLHTTAESLSLQAARLAELVARFRLAAEPTGRSAESQRPVGVMRARAA